MLNVRLLKTNRFKCLNVEIPLLELAKNVELCPTVAV